MSGASVRQPVRLQVVQLAARRSKGSLGRGFVAASSKSYTNLQDMLQKGKTMVKVCCPTGWNLMFCLQCRPLCSHPTARAYMVLGLQLMPGVPVRFSLEALALARQLAALSGPQPHQI